MSWPISTDQTRLMGIGIHKLNIALLPDQFEQDDEGREQSLALAEFLCLIHAPYFFPYFRLG